LRRKCYAQARQLRQTMPKHAALKVDFIYKLGIVQKELNETAVWPRVFRISLGKHDLVVALIQENWNWRVSLPLPSEPRRRALRLPSDDN
jgi:hypothetical protein